MHTFFKPLTDHGTVYLMPGEIHFSLNPVQVITILGSCVSVTMFCRSLHVGSICHAMMPTSNDQFTEKPNPKNDFRYVDRSIEWMMAQFHQVGAPPDDIEVMILGGSHILSSPITEDTTPSVGMKNIETALKAVKGLGLFLRTLNVSGNRGRKVIFNTATGEMTLQYLDRAVPHLATISTPRNR